jgi:hypothetical protein
MNKSFGLATVVLASALASTASFADEVQCVGTLGAVSVDNIFVPDGASCVLDRTRANGNVVVGRGARLNAAGVSINGNVQAEGAANVIVRANSMIGGSVQIVQGVAAKIVNTRVKGDVYFDANAGLVQANFNRVGGNLQAFQNAGGVTVNGNTIDGNLQCKENLPAPTGGGNRAASKEDQCESL